MSLCGLLYCGISSEAFSLHCDIYAGVQLQRRSLQSVSEDYKWLSSLMMLDVFVRFMYSNKYLVYYENLRK